MVDPLPCGHAGEFQDSQPSTLLSVLINVVQEMTLPPVRSLSPALRSSTLRGWVIEVRHNLNCKVNVIDEALRGTIIRW